MGTELEGSTVLELGAGTGFLSLGLAEAGVNQVFAVEGDADAWENLNLSWHQTCFVSRLHRGRSLKPPLLSRKPK